MLDGLGLLSFEYAGLNSPSVDKQSVLVERRQFGVVGSCRREFGAGKELAISIVWFSVVAEVLFPSSSSSSVASSSPDE